MQNEIPWSRSVSRSPKWCTCSLFKILRIRHSLRIRKIFNYSSQYGMNRPVLQRSLPTLYDHCCTRGCQRKVFYFRFSKFLKILCDSKAGRWGVVSSLGKILSAPIALLQKFILHLVTSLSMSCPLRLQALHLQAKEFIFQRYNKIPWIGKKKKENPFIHWKDLPVTFFTIRQGYLDTAITSGIV